MIESPAHTPVSVPNGGAAAVLDVLDRGVIQLDASGRVVRWNRWVVEFTEIPADQALGLPLEQVLGHDPRGHPLYEILQETRDFGRARFWSAALRGSPLSSDRVQLRRHSLRFHPLLGDKAPFGVVLELWDAAAGDRVEDGMRRAEARIQELEQQLRSSEASRREILEVDPVTGLATRSQVHDFLAATIARCLEEDRLGAVFHLDLDGFKRVNEAVGRSAADQVLHDVARRLGRLVRASDAVARVGADEFLMILDGLEGEDDAERTARRVTECFQKPFMVRGDEVFLTASLGATLFPLDGTVADSVMHNAEAALYSVREDGGAGFKLFEPGMNAQSHAMLRLRNALHWAVEQEGFKLVYQPQVDLRSHRVIGVEALLRWDRPDHGPLSPGTFVPVLEDIGLIERVGDWVLREACGQAAGWHAKGSDLRVSVNVSPRQMRGGRRLVDKTRRVLAETGLDPSALELELTEGSLIHDVDQALDMLEQLREMGVRVAVDDFGTGYSSLMYLRRFPIDTLKIDRAFISNVAIDPEDAAICSTIIRLGDTLGLDVLAEGVETLDQLSVVETNGGNLIQGYVLSRPLSLQDITEWVNKDPSLAVPRPSQDAI